MVSDGYGRRLIITMDGDFSLIQGVRKGVICQRKKPAGNAPQLLSRTQLGNWDLVFPVILWGKCGVIFTSPDFRH
jgi:hypothetical protein